jgi:hypothetical protein
MDASDGSMDTGTSNDAPMSSAHKRVFVSSKTYTGLIDPSSNSPNGVDDGDKACNALAQGGGLGGAWRAFLAGYSGQAGAVSAIDHLGDVGPWYLVDGATLVFTNKAALASAAQHAIDQDETGRAAGSGQLVWTGQVGTLMFCNSWTSESPSNRGLVGQVDLVANWAVAAAPNTVACSESHPIYCFEQ